MTKGAVLIANNNSHIDYIKQAEYLAKRIKKYLDLPTSLITADTEYVNTDKIFDKVIYFECNSCTKRTYRDGKYSDYRSLEFKNTSRSAVYDLSPYNETLLMDTDYIINNSILKKCFDQSNNFLIYKDSFELSGQRDTSEFEYINDLSVDFYWATVVFFRKSKITKIYFDLVKHIQENWSHYKFLYNISSGLFRNDYVFSIALHIMNGNADGSFAKKLPGTLYYCTDKDFVVSNQDDKFNFLLENPQNGQYFLTKTEGISVHIMNKFSLERIINDS